MTDRLRLHDGRSMPRLGLGIYQIPAAETGRIVAEALMTGYRLVDGAAIYGNEQGLGEGVRNSGVTRDEVFVTTKLWNDAQGFDAALRAFEASQKRLGLDYVDLYLIHWPCPAHDRYVDSWRALIRLRDEGRVKSIGVSNFNAAQIDRLNAETGVLPVLNQIELYPGFQQAQARADHAARGVVTQSWTPLGRGKVFDAAAVRAIAAREGVTPGQVVLAWHLALGLSAIPRTVQRERLIENLAAVRLRLTAEDLSAIAALDAGDRQGPDPAVFG